MSAGRRVALLLSALLALAVTDCRARLRGRGRGLCLFDTASVNWTEPGCRRARCWRGRLVLDDCPPLPDVLPSGCRRRDGHDGMPYPDCCPMLECRPPDDLPCYVPELKRHAAVEETWTLRGCGQALCLRGGSVTVKGCDVIKVPPGYPCSLGDRDDSLEYPQCCPKVTCRECYSRRNRRFFGPGDSWTVPGRAGCIKKTCRVDNATQPVSISAVPCPLEALPFPDCKLADGPAAADYPACCPTVRCPDRCYSAALDRWFSVGDEWTEEGCTRARCTGTDQVSMMPCGPIAMEPDCRVVEGNATAEYPACCPTVQCVGPDQGCYAEELGHRVAVGETWTYGRDCGLATCGEGGLPSVKGCGSAPGGTGCFIYGNDSLEYPLCCPRVVCPGVCYSKKLDRRFRPGDTWTEGGCIQMSCSLNADGSVKVSTVPCPLEALPFPDCGLAHWPEQADYPACCPTVRCPGRCYSAALDRWFSVGDEWTEEGCTRARCTDTDQVSMMPCGLIAVEPDCRVVEGNATAEYPACCPTVQCVGPDQGCYAEELGHRVAVGETWTYGRDCGLATCTEVGLPSVKGCGSAPGGTGCFIYGNDSLEYPLCCPRVVCPGVCYSKKLDRRFRPGDTWTEGGCIQMSCSLNADGSVKVSAMPCPLTALPFPDCGLAHWPEEVDYPACCPTVRCPDRCYSAALDRWFSVGDEWTEEGCTRARCTGTDRVVRLPCGLIALPRRDCQISDPTSGEYPACCPVPRCPGACFSRGLSRLFPVNSTWTEPGCTRAACVDTDTVVSETCPRRDWAQSLPPNCQTVEQAGEFPDCCPVHYQCQYEFSRRPTYRDAALND